MRRARSERGAAAVEFALVLPLLLTIVFGTIEWGYYFFNRQVVINSAREGARAGTLQYASGTSASAVAVTTAENYLTSAGLPLTRDSISVARIEFKTADGGTCPSGSSCIRVQYDLPTLTGFLDGIFGTTRTVEAYAQMRK
ncbi:TadE family protein [Anaeromyxobacter dehalogenans 2CP-1]|uniref:TadE family protein n=1 Tax=Anaeromyxobacter dehalogenans (strain ATCC BAA-258 / DSM 21875 / 2CP-1) TaxID=455488 RepID=B8JFG3_ANAD2|nr:TadE family protein [Anaeromyxobacter dehalogenans]ACL66340.1 TadE family protein [Anaeromyxobacter dehalogenans 2CP-1]